MKDFFISFFFNLIFRTELLVVAILALLCHIFFKFPIAIAYVLFGVWILVALFVTLGLELLSKNTHSTPYQKNVNPYSKSSNDYKKTSKDNETKV